MPFIGIFDSGKGGRQAMAAFRAICPSADIVFLADTENAPYGTKSESLLRTLVCEDIRRLCDAGAEKILMACCTASSLYDTLPPPERKAAFPIIHPTALAAVRASRNHRIGVLATDATVRSGMFCRAVTTLLPNARIFSAAASPLVPLVEAGITDEHDKRVTDAVENLTRPLCDTGIDTLILGCTHFPALSRAIGARFPGVTLISSVAEGAKAFAATLAPEETRGSALTVEL